MSSTKNTTKPPVSTGLSAAVPATGSGQPDNPGRTAAEIRLWEALIAHPASSAADLATHAAVGKSTAGKILPRWHAQGLIIRTPSQPTGQRRTPDLWAVTAGANEASAPPSDSSGATDDTAHDAPEADTSKPVPAANGKQRLPKGALRGMVEDFLGEDDRVGRAYTPGEIARKLARSSGAVSNALDRLVDDGTVVQASQKPRRFRLADETTRT